MIYLDQVRRKGLIIMELNRMVELLTSVLRCGSADLEILANCEYPMDDVINESNGLDSELSVNGLCYAMFQLALYDVQNAIDARKEELLETFQDKENDGTLTEEERSDWVTLKNTEFNVYDDTESFHNFIDTDIYIHFNEDLYRKFFPEALEIMEEKTGFSF